MSFIHLLPLHSLINIRIHNEIPKLRNYTEHRSIKETKRKHRHLVIHLQSSINLIGIHMMIRMPMRSEQQQISHHIHLRIPRTQLSYLILIFIIPVNQSVMLNVLNEFQKNHTSQRYPRKYHHLPQSHPPISILIHRMSEKNTHICQISQHTNNKRFFTPIIYESVSSVISLPSVNIHIFAFRRSDRIFISSHVFMMKIDMLYRIGREKHDRHIEKSNNLKHSLVSVNKLMRCIDWSRQNEHQSEISLNALTICVIFERVVDVKFAYCYPSEKDITDYRKYLEDVPVFLSCVEDGNRVWGKISTYEERCEDVGKNVCWFVESEIDSPNDSHIEAGVVVR